MRITTILPVSRVGYLDRVLESLEKQTHKPDRNIIIFDGSDEDFEIVQNKVFGKNYEVYRSNNLRPAFAITERRQHIANIHNQAKALIDDDGWVFSIEDDGILPHNALERLTRVAAVMGDHGMVSGVELGRWGVPYVGAWKVNDTERTTQVISLENHAGEDLIDEIDGCGLYCALIRTDLYKSHTFDAHNGLGPDLNLGLDIRRKGFVNYIDWGVPVTHLTNKMGIEMEIPATDFSMVVVLSLIGNNTWAQTKYNVSYGQNPYGVL